MILSKFVDPEPFFGKITDQDLPSLRLRFFTYKKHNSRKGGRLEYLLS
jgi:hypothetical protein